jgi:hypothetical protein
LTSADFLSDTHPSPRAKRRTEGLYIRGASRTMRHSRTTEDTGVESHTSRFSLACESSILAVRLITHGRTAAHKTQEKRTDKSARTLKLHILYIHTHTHTHTHTHARTHAHYWYNPLHTPPHADSATQRAAPTAGPSVLFKTVDTKSKEIDKSRIFPHFQAHCNLLFQAAWDAGTVSLPYEPLTSLQHTVLS